ncbi:MAG: YbgC/FadM family acyl-CoA thioesterase [Sphingobium sp.]
MTAQPVPPDLALPPDLPVPASGRFIDGIHYFPARVYFEDTDAGGIVYHANYLRIMERARSDMLRVAGIDQRGTLDRGDGVYAVAKVTISYRRPARLDDDLIVVSKVIGVGAATCAINQTIMRGSETLTLADVTAAYMTPKGRPKRQPEPWRAIFNCLAEGKDLPA